jgi:hypothetical protein
VGGDAGEDGRGAVGGEAEEMEGGREGMDGAGSVEERRGRRTVGRGRQEGKERGEAATEGRWGGGRVWSARVDGIYLERRSSQPLVSDGRSEMIGQCKVSSKTAQK